MRLASSTPSLLPGAAPLTSECLHLHPQLLFGMNPIFFDPLGVSRLPGMKNLIEEAPLPLLFARHPHVVGSLGRLRDLVVAVDVLFGGQHLQTTPFFKNVGPDRLS